MKEQLLGSPAFARAFCLCTLVVGGGLLSACDAPADEPAPAALQTTAAPVVYGEDDRLDWYEHPDEALRTLTQQSIVALIPRSAVDQSDPNNVRITGRTLQQTRDLCETERFLEQPTAANCSGTLVDVDLVITAGHCVDNLADCRRYAWTFDYRYAAEGELAPLTTDDLYACEAIVARALVGDTDFAVVRLDRPVNGARLPAPVRPADEPLALGEPVSIIGFGSGLPAKIDNGGAVLNLGEPELVDFQASVDAFGGNSGSGVFDAAGRMVGILVRGATDYVARGDCTIVSVIEATSTNGEDVVYVQRAIDALCESGGYRGPLCGGPARCVACEDDTTCATDEICLDGQCAAPCEDDLACSDGTVCTEGRCQVSTVLSCSNNTIVERDGCGRTLREVQACGDNDVCSDAACLPMGAGNRCGVAEAIPATTATYTGDMRGAYSADVAGSCGGAGVDRVFTFEVDVPTALRAISRGYDTVLHLRSDCTDASTEIACNDDSRSVRAQGSRLDVDLEPGTYFLFLDAYGGTVGAYDLELQFTPECDCEIGDLQCVDEGVQACIASDGQCPVWSSVEACEDGGLCLDGACIAPAEGNNCAEPIELGEAPPRWVTTVSAGTTATDAAGCATDAPDLSASFTLSAPARVVATGNSIVDMVSFRPSCDADAIACAPVSGGGARVEAALDAGTWIVTAHPSTTAAEGARVQVNFTYEEACEDACDSSGQIQCTGAARYQACVRGPDGCRVWTADRPCEPQTICSEEAQSCVDPSDLPDGPDASEDVTADGSGQGGTADTGAATGRGGSKSGCAAAPAGAAPLWLLVLAALRLRRRRRA